MQGSAPDTHSGMSTSESRAQEDASDGLAQSSTFRWNAEGTPRADERRAGSDMDGDTATPEALTTYVPPSEDALRLAWAERGFATDELVTSTKLQQLIVKSWDAHGHTAQLRRAFSAVDTVRQTRTDLSHLPHANCCQQTSAFAQLMRDADWELQTGICELLARAQLHWNRAARLGSSVVNADGASHSGQPGRVCGVRGRAGPRQRRGPCFQSHRSAAPVRQP